MGDIGWVLMSDGLEVRVYDVDPVTRRLTSRKKLRFTRKLTLEEAQKVVDSNFPRSSEEVKVAAEYLGRLKKE